MPGAHPKRGEVWVADTADGPEEHLVISSDEWNALGVSDVLTVPIVDGHDEEPSVYAPPVKAGDASKTIWADTIRATSKDALREADWSVGPEVMRDVDEALQRALTPKAAGRKSAPAGFPLAGQLRLAELEIEGQGLKPVIVLSSDLFAAEVAYAYVIVCRKTSDPKLPRTFEVPLRSDIGKAVCSDIRTVPTSQLRPWRTGSAAVTATERAAIMAAVRRMLALP